MVFIKKRSKKSAVSQWNKKARIAKLLIWTVDRSLSNDADLSPIYSFIFHSFFSAGANLLISFFFFLFLLRWCQYPHLFFLLINPHLFLLRVDHSFYIFVHGFKLRLASSSQIHFSFWFNRLIYERCYCWVSEQRLWRSCAVEGVGGWRGWWWWSRNKQCWSRRRQWWQRGGGGWRSLNMVVLAGGLGVNKECGGDWRRTWFS